MQAADAERPGPLILAVIVDTFFLSFQSRNPSLFDSVCISLQIFPILSPAANTLCPSPSIHQRRTHHSRSAPTSVAPTALTPSLNAICVIPADQGRPNPPARGPAPRPRRRAQRQRDPPPAPSGRAKFTAGNDFGRCCSGSAGGDSSKPSDVAFSVHGGDTSVVIV